MKKRGIRGLCMVFAGVFGMSAVLFTLKPVPVNAAERSTIEMDLTGVKDFSLGEVKLLDEYCVNAFEKEVDYLLSFDADRLLAGFRDTAGVDMRGKMRYPGWENSLIGGHTIGHYITACVHAYQSANITEEEKKQLLVMLTALIDGLKECQDAVGTGYIFGATVRNKLNIEQQFDNVEKNMTNITTQAWVPWYTMHKIFEGLVSVANMTDEGSAAVAATAKEVVSKLGDWVYTRTSRWNEATQRTVLSIEYGGMNDCMYDVYLITGKEEHLKAAHSFDQVTLFEKVYKAEAGENALNNLHANTTIPKFLGALKRYVVTGEKLYFDYAEKFWNMVVSNHTYITGGNSEWEHFGQDNVLDKERTNCNCETCNSYNMLKLTKLLFMITGDVKYADWYENTFLNSILSSQNPETGMTTYFQPMASGYFKVYGEEFTKFWCCTGSGMENFTKLGESFYFHKDNMLFVNQYISSQLNWAEKGITVTQNTDIPVTDKAEFTIQGDFDGTILFRLPDWLSKAAVITVNGAGYDYAVTGMTDGVNGYAVVSGPFSGKTVIEITLPMEVVPYNLPDGDDTYAFKYGPVVLSALLGDTDMIRSTTGVDVTIPSERLYEEKYLADGNDTIVVMADTVDDFMANINSYMVRDDSSDTLKFKLTNVADANLTYVTHYTQYTERYGIYFKFSDDHSQVDSAALIDGKKSARLEALKLDTVQPGYGQYENDTLHNMTESGTGSTGSTENGTIRYANPGGSFSYRMIVDKNGTDLLATFDAADDGKSIKITADGKLVFQEILDSGKTSGYYEKVIHVPEDILQTATGIEVDGEKKDVITFTFESVNSSQQQQSAALCEFLYTVEALSTDSTITEISADTGALYYSKSRNRYLLKVAEDTKEVKVTLGIASPYGYVAVDGMAVDETKSIELTVGNGIYTGYALAVYAADHATVSNYDFVIQKVVAENDTNTADGKLAYFVDCGDHGTNTVSEGDSFGTHNSVTEQLYGIDPDTGYKWGLIDDPEDRYNGSAVSAGLYTANTWCYEFNSLKDGLSKVLTNRYTKNQFETGIPRHLDYTFELEDGTYIVEIGFTDPWGCSRNPSIYAYKDTANEQLLVKNFDVLEETATAKATVVGGRLDLNVRTSDKAINITYIMITADKAGETISDYTYLSGEEPAVPDKEDYKNVTDDSTITEPDTDAPKNDAKGKNKKPVAVIVIAAAVATTVTVAFVAGAFIFRRKKN